MVDKQDEDEVEKQLKTKDRVLFCFMSRGVLSRKGFCPYLTSLLKTKQENACE